MSRADDRDTVPRCLVFRVASSSRGTASPPPASPPPPPPPPLSSTRRCEAARTGESGGALRTVTPPQGCVITPRSIWASCRSASSCPPYCSTLMEKCRSPALEVLLWSWRTPATCPLQCSMLKAPQQSFRNTVNFAHQIYVDFVIAPSSVSPPVKSWGREVEILVLGTVSCASVIFFFLTVIICYKAIKRKPLRKEENGTSRGEYAMSSRCKQTAVETNNTGV
ncbi:hypothetical protein HF521_012405 [Silurus meridionalis]|uniref:Uncharacterized protein n=1 Tax=Silurus meridionalis TaxID=175797 RepID=A0A8T0AGM3_SILME|nr:hypothetical protein HF521_012405 [Silurus meridionalis]